jgi:hypothetical protein
MDWLDRNLSNPGGEEILLTNPCRTRTAIAGAHVLPLDAVVGLEVRDETMQESFIEEILPLDPMNAVPDLEMDIVSHT